MMTDLTITPLGSSVCYELFPLRIDGVAGRIRMVDGEVRAQRLRGTSAGGVVEMSGVVVGKKDAPGFDLVLKGQDLEIGKKID